MTKRLIIILIIGCFTKASIAQGIINNVSFEFGDSWEQMFEPKVQDSTAVLGFRFIGDSAYSFRVESLIRINYVPRTITVDQIQIAYFAEAIGMNKILSAKEGEKWKSSIFTANREDSQHIALHRIGVNNGVALELILFFENRGKDDIKALTLDERNVIGQMTGLMVSESLATKMISVFKDVSTTLEIFTEKEQSFSFMLIDPPSSSKIYRPTKN